MECYIFEIRSSSVKAEEFSLPPHFYIPDQDPSPPSSAPVHCFPGSPSTKSKDSELESKCTHCGKGFESNPAMLDHMRIHSDIDLKGTPKKPTTDVESNTVHLLPNSLAWAATRKCVYKPVIDKNSQDAVEAAITLVEMSRSKSNWTMESDPLDEKKHVSENCNKSFPSDQALLEHVSSHKKERKNEAIVEPMSRKRKRKVKSESGSHVCEICKKSYAMGQQLGGHKRAHHPKLKKQTPISEVQNGEAGLDS